MDALLTAMPLCGPQVQRAYMLVGLAHPHITAKDWAAFARRYVRVPRRRGGLIGIQDRRGYVHAIFCYTVERSSLDGGLGLRIHDLILAHLPGRMLAAALTTFAEQLAAELACAGVSVEIPTTDPNGAQGGDTQVMLEAAGFRASRIRMVRTHYVTGARALDRPAMEPASTAGIEQPHRPGQRPSAGPNLLYSLRELRHRRAGPPNSSFAG